MTARGARAAGAGCLNFGKQKLELSVFKWEVQFHFLFHIKCVFIISTLNILYYCITLLYNFFIIIVVFSRTSSSSSFAVVA